MVRKKRMSVKWTFDGMQEKSQTTKTVQLTWINLQTTLWYSPEGQDCQLGPVGQQDLAHPKH